jgi:hypothetical protein
MFQFRNGLFLNFPGLPLLVWAGVDWAGEEERKEKKEVGGGGERRR